MKTYCGVSAFILLEDVQVMQIRSKQGFVAIMASVLSLVAAQWSAQGMEAPPTRHVSKQSRERHSPLPNPSLVLVAGGQMDCLPLPNIMPIGQIRGQLSELAFQLKISAIKGVTVNKTLLDQRDTLQRELLRRQAQVPSDLVSAGQGVHDLVQITLPTPKQAAPQANQATGQITGTIVAGDTGLPLAGISIYAYRAGAFATSGVSDASGYYTLTGLAANSYMVQFSTPSSSFYTDQYYNGASKPESATSVGVTDGATTANINAVLMRGAIILGEVRGADSGVGLGGVTVRALKQGTTDAYNYVSSDSSDYSGDGKFELVGLPSGSYMLYAEQPSFGGSTSYLSMFYEGAKTIAMATPITVTAGATTTGYVIRMERGSLITGMVTAADTGLPLRNVEVEVYDPNYSPYSYFKSVQTDFDGRYETVGLASGNYRLRFRPSSNSDSAAYLSEWFDDKTSYNSATPTTLTQPLTAANINAILTRGGIITGQVTALQSGLPLQDIRVSILNCRGSTVDSPRTDSNGFYRSIGLVPGYYRVYFGEGSQYDNAQDFTYIPEFFDNKDSSASATPVTMTVAATVSNVSAALATGGAITGVVKAVDTGLPLERVEVRAYSCGPTFCSQSAYAITNADGRYRIGGLASGDYFIQVDTLNFSSSNGNTRRYTGNDISGRTLVTTPQASMVNFALPLGGAIAGRVTDVATGLGISQTSVYVRYATGIYFDEYFYTDVSGYYTATGIPTGNYRVRFQPYGTNVESYIHEYYDNKLTFAEAEAVAVTRGVTTTNINAGLARGGQITGRVTNASGQPLPSAYVEVYDTSGNSRAYDYTDASGYYTTTGGLPNGNYKVRFRLTYGTGTGEETCPAPTLLVSANAPATILGTGLGYAVEYYNHKATLSTADVVPVNGVTITTGINAALSSLSFDVRGRVLSGTVPLASTYVYADNGEYDYTDANGYYTITNMFSGTHTITASAYRVAFNPPSKMATVPGDATGVDFSGTYTTTLPTPDPTPQPAKRFVYLPLLRK